MVVSISEDATLSQHLSQLLIPPHVLPCTMTDVEQSSGGDQREGESHWLLLARLFIFVASLARLSFGSAPFTILHYYHITASQRGRQPL